MRNFFAVGALIFQLAVSGYALASSIATIPGATSDGIKQTTTVGTATVRLPIDINAAAKKFYVTVDDFRGPDSRVVSAKATFNGKPANTPIDISQTDRPILVITADFAAVGDYTSYIVIFHDGAREPSIPLIISRQLVAISIQVDPIDPVALTLPPFQSGDALIHVSVKETGGQSVTLTQGELASLVRKDADKTSFEAHYGGVSLAEGAPSLSLDPQGYKRFPYLVKNIGAAGEYTGTFRIGSPDRTSIDKPVSIFVKEHWFDASLFIFLGVLASYLIRYWTKEGRPKLESLRRIADISSDLDEIIQNANSADPTENSVFLGIKGMLSKVQRSVQQGVGGSQDSTLSELETKVRNLASWLTVGNELRAVTPADIVATDADRWKALADSYFLSSPADAGAFTKEIVSIKADIAASIKNAAGKQIEDFRKTLDAFKKDYPDADQAMVKAVDDGIADASQRIQDGKTKEALSALDAAKAAYARVAAGSLKVILAGAQPLGFSPNAWQDLVRDLNQKITLVAQETNATKAIQLFDEINKTYIHSITWTLLQAIPNYEQDVQKNGNIDKNKKEELGKSLQTVTADLKKALAQLDSGAGNEALGLYTQSAATVTAIVTALAKTGTSLLGEHEFTAKMANWLSPMPEPLNLSGFSSLAPPPPKSARDAITDAIARYNLLLNFGFLIIATVAGLKLLWADSAVWGGLKDYAIAFLWGLGLQQIGASGLDGLPAITKKLTE